FKTTFFVQSILLFLYRINAMWGFTPEDEPPLTPKNKKGFLFTIFFIKSVVGSGSVERFCTFFIKGKSRKVFVYVLLD
ncbi:hypothetical protein, partial [Bacillus mycoides]|uniref:hypothetical protein n=1 Tax=Bacillus mycoides TaxID=1405 RepID=UPI003A7FB987